MSDRTPASERTIHTGICDTCQATFAVWPHWGRGDDIPDPNHWEGRMHTCPVCDEGFMDWDWSDHMAATIRTGYYPEEPGMSTPQIIRTVRELEALDPDTLLLPENFNSPITRQSMDNFGITVSDAHYAVVVAEGAHLRAARKALEEA